jgi:tRNA nucleotidyltransferase/poly(A) polymerase
MRRRSRNIKVMTDVIPVKLAALKKREPLKGLAAAFRSAFPKGELYLVGGTVRDALLGRDDSKDYDIVARGVPADALEKFLGKLGRVDLVGKRFGVWKFTPKDTPHPSLLTPPSPRAGEGKEKGARGDNNGAVSHQLDIALPRTEHSFNSGGYRDVSVDSDPQLPIEQDLARRDFTVNAMALRLTPKPALLDPFEGRKDLKAKIIRTVGDAAERFREDYSRMLRGMRFACQLGFKIDDHALGAIRVLIPHVNDYRSTPGGNMRVVATEIIGRELVKAMTNDPVRAFDLWHESGAMETLMPELLAMRGCRQPKNHHAEGDVWTHTRLALSKIGDKDFMARFGQETPPALVHFAVLFHDIAKPVTMQTPEEHGTDRIRYNNHDVIGGEMAAAIAKRLTLSSAEGFGVDADKLDWIIRHHLFTLHGNIEEIRPNTLEKYFFSPTLPGRELLMTIYCDSMATVPEGGLKPDHLKHLDRLMQRIDDLASLGAGRKLPPPLLDGVAIMKLLKLEPGKRVGEIIEALREAQLSEKLMTKEEAKEFIRKLP